MDAILKNMEDFLDKHWGRASKILIFAMIAAIIALVILIIFMFTTLPGCGLPAYEGGDARMILEDGGFDYANVDANEDANTDNNETDSEFGNDEKDIAEFDEFDVENEADVTCVPTSETELCNGLDDNCDGATDEGFDLMNDVLNCGNCENNCFDLPNVSNAICASGSCASLKCSDGFVNTNLVITDGCECELTGEEICDETDNDCDGKIDEDVPNCCKLGDTKDCGLTDEGECKFGKQVCLADGSWNPDCVDAIGPTDELCDDLDNNCDGNTDENWPMLYGSCSSTGLGECLGFGDIVCAADGKDTMCTAVDNLPSNEICDGKDNDCDGFADDDLGLNEACEVGTGECVATGVKICDGLGGVTCSAIPAEPSEEICDGLDNNCDNIFDNVDPANLNTNENCGKCGHACNALMGVVSAECQLGACVITQCAAKFWDANLVGDDGCECQTTSNVVEICDGIDNDCDGAIDENCETLVMYLPFDGDWNDKSGKGNHATPKNGPVFSADAKMGQSAYFDGLDDYATVADSVTMDSIAGEFTFVISVKPVMFQNNDRVFNKAINRPSVSVVDSKWSIGVKGTDYSSGQAIVANKWITIITVYSGGNLRVYIDNIKVIDASGVANQAGDVMYIGASNFDGSSVAAPIRANIDEFQFYSHAWSEPEIANYYQKIQ